jgi:hypothetical protein
MPGDMETLLEGEIARLRRRFAPLLRELSTAVEAPARWTYGEAVLRWHVVLESVLEPDVDIEFLPGLLLVRAKPQPGDRPLLQALLPIPSGFVVDEAHIRAEPGYLEVCLRRVHARRGRS